MGFLSWMCCCNNCCKKKKDSDEEAEPTEEELRAKEIEEAEREAAERDARKKGGHHQDDDESSSGSDSDGAPDEILEKEDENVIENDCDRIQFDNIMRQANDKVYHTEIFNLVDDANETPEHCLYNWGRPRRWHVNVTNITAENITDQMLPEVFFHLSIGGPMQLTECIVENKKLYQLGSRGMSMRTRSRKHWSPNEIQVFQEKFEC